MKTIAVRPIASADRIDILRINARCRPAVAALDEAELDRLLALGDAHRVAVSGGDVIAYMLVFARRCAYDGEEFRYFCSRLQEPFLYRSDCCRSGSPLLRRGVPAVWSPR